MRAGFLASLLGLFQLLPVMFSQFAGFGVLALLQRADVSDDLPAVFRRHDLGVARHRAEAVGHHVVEVAGRGVAQTILMIARRMAEAAQRYHSVAVTQFAVAGQARNVEPALAAIEYLHDLFLASLRVRAELERESVFADRTDLTRHSRPGRGDGQRKRTARDRAFGRLPVRAVLVGFEPGVVVHVLAAGRNRDDHGPATGA